MTRLSLVLALSSVLIAACGSDGGGDGDTSGTTGDRCRHGDPGAAA